MFTKWNSLWNEARSASGFHFKASREMRLASPDKPSGWKPEDSTRGVYVNSTDDVYEAKGQHEQVSIGWWLWAWTAKIKKILSVVSYLIDTMHWMKQYSPQKRAWKGSGSDQYRWLFFKHGVGFSFTNGRKTTRRNLTPFQAISSWKLQSTRPKENSANEESLALIASVVVGWNIMERTNSIINWKLSRFVATFSCRINPRFYRKAFEDFIIFKPNALWQTSKLYFKSKLLHQLQSAFNIIIGSWNTINSEMQQLILKLIATSW